MEPQIIVLTIPCDYIYIYIFIFSIQSSMFYGGVVSYLPDGSGDQINFSCHLLMAYAYGIIPSASIFWW